MELRYSELENGIACIELIGTMDTQGVGAIEIKFAGYSSGDRARVLVDLSNVDFMASIGIRLLITRPSQSRAAAAGLCCSSPMKM